MSEWIIEVFERGPMPVDDHVNQEELEAEMAERLEALLACHMLEPTAEGWRDLALKLALQHEPAFRIETPVERTGSSGMDGRPGRGKSFFMRWDMQSQMRKGMSKADAAKVVAKKWGVEVGTAANLPSRKNIQPPDEMRRMKYERKAEGAIQMAARKLSQE